MLFKRFLIMISIFLAAGSAFGKDTRPNIILVLVDDMGWGDVGCFYQNDRSRTGKPALTTPNLDKMAKEGIQLRRHYSGAPVCAPSRASLFSGVHQGNARVVRDNTFDMPLENSHTLASVLKQAGYSTALIGKWGIGGGKESGGSPEESTAFPTKRGFDYFFGWLDHIAAHRHYPKEDPHDKQAPGKQNNLWDQDKIITEQSDNSYSTDLITARAKKWISDESRSSPDKPFFLAMTYIAPHAALEVATQPYPQGGGLKGGLQWIGKPGQLVNTSTGGTRNSFIEPRYASKNWPEFAKRHASMIARIDDGIGDIVHLLKDLKIDDNTFIVFLSDNGPHNEGSFLPFTQNPAFFASYGIFDGIKRDTWEGGFRVPAIARWPKGIPAGKITNTPGQFHDWMATFADMANIPTPERSDGVSMLPTLSGKGIQKPGIVYTEYNINLATPAYKDFAPSHQNAPRRQMQVIMEGKYKGVRQDISSADDSFMIFDTEKDPGERNNLAGTSPEMEKIQNAMKKRVLQIRRPYDYFNNVRGNLAKRPYDKALVPPADVNPAKLASGLSFSLTAQKALPWVPKQRLQGKSLKTEGISIPASIAKSFTGHWTGYINIPEDGEYKFFVSTEANKGSKAFVRLHDMQLVDADFCYTPGTEVDSSSAMGTAEAKEMTGKSPVYLKKGLHPITIGYVHGEGDNKAKLLLQWEGTGISKTPVPNSAFFTAASR